ncbi:hypothetical protein GUITHDRAFT_108071 [Guillardia theta CCMP2712]|uniref:PDZ domain-containing protein n=1 Tax=Guillardia theta (strain CCMP2712) TaxID=905079 RepID=L1JD40_GUITC|nr:hypothetical protein GUITHDRAFT_108071 [Guillardia theta CCMP2712]EKX46034.1 hypothetical protein GUITHDRAFT_108071 [Guillardia theta CCMP2712]|eukprot:XP_005833014.1 hypothetical protein GUITHDRAFT_108071 [Guillardia theta CCMP2712]
MSYLRYDSYYGASRPQAPTPIGGVSPPEERYQSYQMQYQVQPQPEPTQFQAFQYQPQVRQFTSPSYMQPQPVQQVPRSQSYGYDRMASYQTGNYAYDRQVPVSQMPVAPAAQPGQPPVNVQSSYVRKDESALSFERPNVLLPQPTIHMNQPSFVQQPRNDDLYSSQDRRAAQESGSYRLVSRDEGYRQSDPVQQPSDRSNLFSPSGVHDRISTFSPSGDNRNNGMTTPVQNEIHNDDRAAALRQYDRQREYAQSDLLGRRPSEDKKQSIYNRPINSAPSPAHERHHEINRMANATPTNVIPPSASPLPTSASNSTGLVGIGIVFQQKNDGRMYIKSLIEGEAASLAEPRPLEGDCIIGVDDNPVEFGCDLAKLRTFIIGRPSTAVILRLRRSPDLEYQTIIIRGNRSASVARNPTFVPQSISKAPVQIVEPVAQQMARPSRTPSEGSRYEINSTPDSSLNVANADNQSLYGSNSGIKARSGIRPDEDPVERARQDLARARARQAEIQAQASMYTAGTSGLYGSRERAEESSSYGIANRGISIAASRNYPVPEASTRSRSADPPARRGSDEASRRPASSLATAMQRLQAELDDSRPRYVPKSNLAAMPEGGSLYNSRDGSAPAEQPVRDLGMQRSYDRGGMAAKYGNQGGYTAGMARPNAFSPTYSQDIYGSAGSRYGR